VISNLFCTFVVEQRCGGDSVGFGQSLKRNIFQKIIADSFGGLERILYLC
jgi:hypothetical protein